MYMSNLLFLSVRTVVHYRHAKLGHDSRVSVASGGWKAVFLCVRQAGSGYDLWSSPLPCSNGPHVGLCDPLTQRGVVLSQCITSDVGITFFLGGKKSKREAVVVLGFDDHFLREWISGIAFLTSSLPAFGTNYCEKFSLPSSPANICWMQLSDDIFRISYGNTWP